MKKKNIFLGALQVNVAIAILDFLYCSPLSNRSFNFSIAKVVDLNFFASFSISVASWPFFLCRSFSLSNGMGSKEKKETCRYQFYGRESATTIASPIVEGAKTIAILEKLAIR